MDSVVVTFIMTTTQTRRSLKKKPFSWVYFPRTDSTCKSKFKKIHHLMMFWYERKRMARKRFDLKSNHPSTKSDLAFKRLQSRISPRCSRLKCSKLLAAVFSDPCSLKLFRICSVAALASCSSIFFIEEVSLVCFDRSVATFHRRALVYTTFPSLWFSSLGVFITQLRINVVLTAFFWSLSMLYWT